MSTKAAKTTVKVATINSAAKDDYFQNLDWLVEDGKDGDGRIAGTLNVLANDPGSAKIVGWSADLPTTSAQLTSKGDLFEGKLQISINPTSGELDIDASGLNGDIQSLGEGEVREIVFYYTAQMANGAYSTAKVTFEIVGVNDDAVFGGDDSGSVTEDGGLTALGVLTVNDVDGADTIQAQNNVAGKYGSFSIDAAGNWSYTLDNDDDDLDDLDAGDTDTESFDVYSADGTKHTIVITVNGANETPNGPTGPVVPADNNYVNAAANDQDDPSVISALAGATVVTQTTHYNATHGDDTIVGNGDGQKINGRQGGDKIHGAGGEDQINGNEDSDTLWGGSGNDQLNAGAGADTVYGGSGNDTIAGGAGADQLWGGTGADTFTFVHGDSTAASSDTVNDFSRVEGDKIGVAGLGLSWQGILSSAADLSAGGLGYVVNGNGTLTVFADTNGEAGYQADDLSFVIAGTSNLIATDFLF